MAPCVAPTYTAQETAPPPYECTTEGLMCDVNDEHKQYFKGWQRRCCQCILTGRKSTVNLDGTNATQTYVHRDFVDGEGRRHDHHFTKTQCKCEHGHGLCVYTVKNSCGCDTKYNNFLVVSCQPLKPCDASKGTGPSIARELAGYAEALESSKRAILRTWMGGRIDDVYRIETVGVWMAAFVVRKLSLYCY